ncbi:MAG: hypothetical protein IJ867_00460 [Clostridia bacterium]|nr:hypothetical protein [Clostridia bacterium]
MKSNKGITLVALVITIIVLLILAGVSISLVVGDNGVLTRASDSSNKTKISQIYEAVGLALADIQTQYMGDKAEKVSTNMDNYFTEENLAYELSTQGYQLRNASAKVTSSAFSKTGGTRLGCDDPDTDTEEATVTYKVGDGKDAVAFTFEVKTSGYTIKTPESLSTATSSDSNLIKFE